MDDLADDQYDYAAMKLDCTVGNQTGWFGWWWQTTSLDGQVSKIIGYPGDKAGQQWKSKDYVRYTDARRLFYGNDTAGGNSGSPVFRIRGANEPMCAGPVRHGRARLRHLRQLPLRLVQPRHAGHPGGLRQLLPLAQQLALHRPLGQRSAVIGRGKRPNAQVARRVRRLVRTSGHSAARIEYIAVSRAPG